MKKIFQEILLSDGGPNDRGTVIGYVTANSKEELKPSHTFIEFHEIEWIVYNRLKLEAKTNYQMFKY
jgi:hypothetical protein